MTESLFDLGRHSDASDEATLLEMAESASALKKIQDRVRHAPLSPDFDGKNCVKCGDEIDARRLASVRTDKCVTCVNQEELRGRQYAK